MYKSFTKLKYFMSWWAFTFPITAITIASVLAYQITLMAIFKYAAWILFSSAIIIIGIVAHATIKHALKGEICIKEE